MATSVATGTPAGDGRASQDVALLRLQRKTGCICLNCCSPTVEVSDASGQPLGSVTGSGCLLSPCTGTVVYTVRRPDGSVEQEVKRHPSVPEVPWIDCCMMLERAPLLRGAFGNFELQQPSCCRLVTDYEAPRSLFKREIPLSAQAPSAEAAARTIAMLYAYDRSDPALRGRVIDQLINIDRRSCAGRWTSTMAAHFARAAPPSVWACTSCPLAPSTASG
jgi:hypothetical protein